MPARNGHKPPPGFFPQRSLGPPRPWRQATVHQPIAFHVEPGLAPGSSFLSRGNPSSLGSLQQKALQINRCTRLGVQFLPEVGEHPFVVPVPSQGHHQVRLKAVVAQTPAGAL